MKAREDHEDRRKKQGRPTPPEGAEAAPSDRRDASPPPAPSPELQAAFGLAGGSGIPEMPAGERSAGRDKARDLEPTDRRAPGRAGRGAQGLRSPGSIELAAGSHRSPAAPGDAKKSVPYDALDNVDGTPQERHHDVADDQRRVGRNAASSATGDDDTQTDERNRTPPPKA